MDQAAIEQMLQQARMQIQAGQLESAAGVLQQVLSQEPGHPEANAQLGLVALIAGQLGPAEIHLRAALKANPSHLPAASNLAILLRRTGRSRQAMDLQRQVVSLDPEPADHHYNLGNTLLDLKDFDAAVGCYQNALARQPNHAQAMTNLARAYQLTLQHEKWFQTLGKAAEISRDPLPLSNLIFSSMFSPGYCGGDVAKLAADWDARFGRPLLEASAPVRFENSKEPERILRVGYVAPTFRQHTIGLLIEPILARHDRGKFRICCYGDVPRPDEVTQRISESVDDFKSTFQMSDEQLARQIREDRIDILIDLNAHMAGSRLGVFARRAAPVQIGYLAYPFTCGLRAMDYRVTDQILEPPGAARFGPECSIRLNHSFWLYRPDPKAAEPAEMPPSPKNGYVTFGNLNNVQKLNEPLLKAWGEILRAHPGSRLMQLTNDVVHQGSYLLAMFVKAGIARERIELVESEPHHLHLNRYRQIDLCLDPFPYGGHTTTLDATWMGVPTLTLAGDAPYMRGAASILRRVELDSLVTRSVDEYVRAGIESAGDPVKLASIRAGLRQRMQSSALCDETGFVAEFERGLRSVWKRYCNDLPPRDLDISG